MWYNIYVFLIFNYMSEGEFGSFHTSEGEPFNFRPHRQGAGGEEKWGTHTIGKNEKGKPQKMRFLKEVKPVVTAPLERGSIEELSSDENPESLLIAKQEGDSDIGDEQEDLARGPKVMETKRGVYPVMLEGQGQGSGEVVGLRKSVGTIKVDRGGYYGLPVKNIKEKRRHLDKQRGKAERGKK